MFKIGGSLLLRQLEEPFLEGQTIGQVLTTNPHSLEAVTGLRCGLFGPVLAKYSIMTGRSSLKVPLAEQVEWLRRVDPVIHRVAAIAGLRRCARLLPLPFHRRGYPGQARA